MLDLRRASRLFYGAAEAQALYRGGDLLWTRPAQISDYYGIGAGQVPLRLRSADAVMSGGFVQRIPNMGGAGTPFDLAAGVNTIPLINGAMDLTPAQWLRWTNLTQQTAIDMMGTRVFIVADLRGLTVDQYCLGNGNPQANIWIEAGGGRMRVNRRNPLTNSFETVNINLNPAISGVLRLYEIEFLSGGAPNANGQTSGGTIRVFVNGELSGSAAHIFPELRVFNYAAGQNPGNGNGLNARVFDTLSIIQGGAYSSRVPIIRQRLNTLYGLGI